MNADGIHDIDRKVFEAARRWRAEKVKQISIDLAGGRVSAAHIVRQLRAIADEIEQVSPSDPTELRLCAHLTTPTRRKPASIPHP